MAITPEQIGQRLRLARNERRITQDAAGTALDLPRSAVSLMESGQRQISTLELSRLADLYGRPVEWFISPNVPTEEEDPVVALFRMEPSLKSDLVQTQASHCIQLFREGASLARLLGRETAAVLPRYDLAIPRSTGFAIAQGQSVADQERRRLGLGAAPVRSIPELIGSQGIWASAMRLPEEMSGLFLRSAEFGMGILVNIRHSPVRRRFSYAHEYGHALMDRDQPASVTSIHNSKNSSEQRANAFAAAFLMPEEGVRDFLHGVGKGRGSRREEAVVDAVTEMGIRGELRAPPRSQDVTYADAALLGRHFGASYPAAVWRLRGLNLINAEETDALLKQTDAAHRYLRAVRDFTTLDEVADAPPAESHEDHELDWQVLPLALEAWRRGEISQGRLLELGRLLEVEDETMLDLAEAVGAE